MNYLKLFLVLYVLVLLNSCNSDETIIKLLKSNNSEDVIYGAYKAAQTNNKKFVPLLLLNADDWATSTQMRFYGLTVYFEKIHALQNIYDIPSPHVIDQFTPDSVNIKFYEKIYLADKKANPASYR